MLRLALILFSFGALSCKSEEPTVAPATIIQNLPVVPPKEYTFAAVPFWADEFDKDGLPDAS